MTTDVLIGQLEARAITHRFGGALALDHVDFEVRSGEIHALLGENGAGKSTLVKVLTGALTPDEGEVVVGDVAHRLRSPRQAQDLGISVVYQDFHLFPHLTVGENIFAASPNPPSRGGLAARRAMYDSSHELLQSFGIEVDPRRLVGSLDAAERKLIEISRALLTGPGYLVLDEPTAALEPRETVRLLGVISKLRERGTGIILVTHRLGEVTEIADRATVLRNGSNVGLLERSDFSMAALAEMIVGQEVGETEPPRHVPVGVALRVRGVQVRADAAPVEIAVGRGELVSVIGLIGSGVSAVLNTACGAIPARGAEVEVDGRWRIWKSRRQAQAAGIGAVPIDRKASGLILDSSVAGNVGLATLSEFSRLGFTSKRRLREAARECQRVFDIRLASVDQPVRSLSGGNQQKVMLGRWRVRKSPILVIQEPTQGVDIGARQEIHRYLVDFAENGGSVLFSSSDLEEVRGLSHRIYVMHAGEVVAEFDNVGEAPPSRSELTQAMAAGSLSAHEKEIFE